MLGIAAAIFSVLLIATGTAKIASPDDTARAIRTLGIRAHREIGRVIGIVEVVVGVGAMLIPVWLAAQAALYLAFLIWIVLAMRSGAPIESCGCLGSPDTPPYWGHLAVNTLAPFLSVLAVVTASPPLLESAGPAPAASLVLVALGAFLAWAVIGDGARLHGAVTGR